jgi:hypothetical protein
MKKSKLKIALMCLGILATVPVRGFCDPPPNNGGTNLWLEITGRSNQLFSFAVHNTASYEYYEILAKADLSSPVWIPTSVFSGSPVNGVVHVLNQDESCYWWADSECYWTPNGSMPASLFFMAWVGSAEPRFYLDHGTNCFLVQPADTNTPGQSLTFNIEFSSLDKLPTPLLVNFQVLGSAVNGVDYSITGMQVVGSTGSIIIPSGSCLSSNIVITSQFKTNGVYGNSTLTLAMALGNNYVLDLGNEGITLIFSNPIPAVITNISPNPFNMETDTITVLGSGFAASNVVIHIEDYDGGMDSDGYWMKGTFINSGKITAVYGGPGNGIIENKGYANPETVLVYYQDAYGRKSNALLGTVTGAGTTIILNN